MPQDIVVVENVGDADIENTQPVEDVQGLASVDIHPLIRRVALTVGRSPDGCVNFGLRIPVSSDERCIGSARSKGIPKTQGPGLPFPFEDAGQGMDDLVGRGGERGSVILLSFGAEEVVNENGIVALFHFLDEELGPARVSLAIICEQHFGPKDTQMPIFLVIEGGPKLCFFADAVIAQRPVVSRLRPEVGLLSKSKIIPEHVISSG